METSYKCLFCGAEMNISGQENCCDHGDYEEDDPALITFMQCPNCGSDYEIWDPRQEEREGDYKPYWDKHHGNQG